MSTLVKVNDKGLFNLAPPFSAAATIEYTVSRVSTINSLLIQGVDVQQDIYLSNGLTSDDYEQALEDNVLIITLSSSTAAEIVVPSDYIRGTPNINTVDYTRRIISVDLGNLPTTMPLADLIAAVKTTVLETTGVNPSVSEFSASTTGAVSMDQHIALEEQRALNKANGGTERQRRIDAERKANEYRDRALALEAIVVAQQERLDQSDA